jgi:hypothetical protein
MADRDDDHTAGMTRRDAMKAAGTLVAAAATVGVSAAASSTIASAAEKSKEPGELTVIQYVLSRL